MARIVISSRGTLGDYLPFVALGRCLKQRGHHVVLALNQAVHNLAKRAGLEVRPCGQPLGPEQVRRLADGWDHWHPLPKDIARKRLHLLDFTNDYRDLSAASRGADILITSCFQEAGTLVHERTGIPWVSVAPTPMIFRHSGDPVSRSPWGSFYEYQNEIRARLGFRKLPPDLWEQSCLSDELALLASSRHFSRPVPERYPGLRLTGFWFDDETVADFDPAPELRAFLDDEPHPLILTYSGLPVVDPARVLRVHAEAATLLGKRLLVLRGWAGFTARMLPARLRPVTFFCNSFVPHGWLFPRAGAVMHHAGLGTTASAIRAGCPMVAEPYGNDQFQIASRILKLGVGVAVNPHRIGPEELACLLAENVLGGSSRQCALTLSAKLQAEDGLTRACELIETTFVPARRRTGANAQLVS